MENQDQDIRDLLFSGKKIHAIKLYRERYGIGLKEAKEAVDAMEEFPQPLRFGSGSPVVETSSLQNQLTPAEVEWVQQEIQALLRDHKKIMAIKLYREHYHVGLKEAKDVIDSMEASLRASDRLSPPIQELPGSHPGQSDAEGEKAFRQEVEAMLWSSKRIQAIKLYRQRYKVGLKEAKEAIDGWAKEVHAPEGKTGCFIATAAFGSAEAPEVVLLRSYRDRVLSQSVAGRAFIRTYYLLSPPLARLLRRSPAASAFVRWLLQRVIPRLDNR